MTIHLKIVGMHCSGCANAVREALKSTPLVTSVHVEAGSGSATVEVAANIDPARLVAAVKDAGYQARVDG
jgi:Cu+-exporting ATPase